MSMKRSGSSWHLRASGRVGSHLFARWLLAPLDGPESSPRHTYSLPAFPRESSFRAGFMPFGSLTSGSTGSPEPSTLPSAGDSNPTSGAFSAPVFHPNFPGPTRGIFCQFGGRQFITIRFHTGHLPPRPQPVYLDGPCCSGQPRTLLAGRKPRISARNPSSCLRRVAQNHLWGVFLPSVFSNSFCDPSWRKFTNPKPNRD